MAAIKLHSPQHSLVDLKQRIRDEAATVEKLGATAVKHAWQCGVYLREAKAEMGHGGFVEYLNSEEWGRGQNTAYRYIQIAMLNLPSLVNVTLIGDAERLAKQDAKPRIRDRVLCYVQENPRCTDDDIAEALDEKPASVRGRRVELQKAGLLEKCGQRRVDGSKKPVSLYQATDATSEDDVQVAKQKAEDAALKEHVEKTASKLLAMDARTRAAVLRRVNADPSVAKQRERKLFKSGMRGETVREHVVVTLDEMRNMLRDIQHRTATKQKSWMGHCDKETMQDCARVLRCINSESEKLAEIFEGKAT